MSRREGGVWMMGIRGMESGRVFRSDGYRRVRFGGRRGKSRFVVFWIDVFVVFAEVGGVVGF